MEQRKNGIPINNVINNKEFIIFHRNQEENEIAAFIKQFTETLNNNPSKLAEIIDSAAGRYEVLEVDDIFSDKPAEKVNSTQAPKHVAAPFNLKYEKKPNNLHGRKISEINYTPRNNAATTVLTDDATINNDAIPTTESTFEPETTAKPSIFNRFLSGIRSLASSAWKIIQKTMDNITTAWNYCFNDKDDITIPDTNNSEFTAPIEENISTTTLKNDSVYLGWANRKKSEIPSNIISTQTDNSAPLISSSSTPKV